MTSFLRKKNKQDSPTKSVKSVGLTSSTSPPPLFARFATTAQKDGGGTTRMVSSPMLLSSQRKDVPQRGLSGNGFGYSSTSLAAGNRDGDPPYTRKMPENNQTPPVPIKTTTYGPSSPTSPRPDSRVFVDKPLLPPIPNTPISSSVPAVSRRTTTTQSPGPPPTFHTQGQNQPVRGRSSLDNYIGEVERKQPLQRAGSAQAQYAPYRFAPTPPAKPNGTIVKPVMGNGHSLGPPPAFARSHLPTSGNLASTSQTLSPQHKYATLDGANGIVGDVPMKRMSLLGPQLQQDAQRTPMSDHGIDLPPEFALFQDYNETISIPSAPNSLNSRRPSQSASGNTVNAEAIEQVPNLNVPQSSVHLVGDAQPRAVPYQPPHPQRQHQSTHSNPSQPLISSPPSPPQESAEMGSAASRVLGPDFLSSSYKDFSAPPRFIGPSDRPPPPLYQGNVVDVLSSQRSPPKKNQRAVNPSSSPPLPSASALIANGTVSNGRYPENGQHTRKPSESQQSQQSQQKQPRARTQHPQTPPSLPHPPSSSHHIYPGQIMPAQLRKTPSMQSANAPQRGKPRIFAAMEAQENEVVNDANVQPPPIPAHFEPESQPDQTLHSRLSLNSHLPQSVNSPLLPPVEFLTPKSRIEDLPSQYGNSEDRRPSSSSSTSILSSSPSKVAPHQAAGSDPLSYTPRSDGGRSLSKPDEPPQQLISPQATPRTRKLSKARSHADNASIISHSSVAAPSTPESRRLHSHASHRSISKSRPSTPGTANKHHQAPSEGVLRLDEVTKVGVPLDEDPFARVEGVKMLNTSTPPPPNAAKPQGQAASSDANTLSEEKSTHLLAARDAKTIATPLTPVSPEDVKKSRKDRKHSKGKKSDVPTPSGTVEIAANNDAVEETPEPVTLIQFLSNPHLLSALLSFLSFYDWCTLSSISKQIRIMLVRTPDLREAVLESHLRTIGYSRWTWDDKEPLSLSLQDLNDYMRGVSTPNHEYARVAAMYVHSLSIHPNHRDPTLAETVRALTASTRAYSRVLLRLRAQAEKEASMHNLNNFQPPPSASASSFKTRAGTSSRVSSRAPSPTTSMNSHSYHGGVQVPGTVHQTSSQTSLTFRSPLFRLRRAPLLRVFVPSPEGDWLSDKSVLECEAECKRAGIGHLLRLGDVVWDVAVGDEGNVGRLVWDGSYLIDLDYTYSPVGDLPKYLPTLAFPPSYFHRVIRTGPNVTNPIVHIDVSPWGEEIAMNLQLLQDRVRTETPQGAYHNVVRWVHRSSFSIRPSRAAHRYNTPPKPGQSVNGKIPIPDSNNLFVDPGWYGTIIVETEGTNEALADLQDRCGPGAFPPRPRGVNGQVSQAQVENRKVFRILREKSRPGEIWIKAVNVKERLL